MKRNGSLFSTFTSKAREVVQSRLFLPAVAALFILANLPTLRSYPALHDDEGWFSCSAASLSTTGRLACDLFKGSQVMQGLDERTYWQPPFYFILLAGLFSLFGKGYMVGRLVSLVAGALVVYLIGALARRLWGKSLIAGLAPVLAALDPFFIVSSRMARMDMIAALAGLALLYQFLRLADGRGNRAWFAAGLLSAVCFMTHPVGAAAVLASWALALVWSVGRRCRPANLVLFAAPQLLALGLWGAYAMADLPAFEAQFGRNCLRSHGTGLSLESFTREVNERYMEPYGLERLPLLALYAGGIVWFVLSRLGRRGQKTPERIVALFAAFYLVLFTFASGSKTSSHLCHLVPYFALSGAFALAALWRRRGKGALLSRGLSGLVLASSLLVLTGHIARIHLLIRSAGAGMDYEAFTGRILERIPKGSVILGGASLWFGLNEADITLLDDPLIDPSEQRSRTIDYVVVLPSTFPRNRKFARLWARPGESFEDRPDRVQAWIDRRGVLVAELGSSEHPLAYRARIYRMNRD